MKTYKKLLLSTSAAILLATPAFAMDPEMAKKFEQLMVVVEQQNQKISELEAHLEEKISASEQISAASNVSTQAMEKVSALELQVQQQQAQLDQQAFELESIEPAAGDTGDNVKIRMRGATPEFDFGNGTKFNLHGRIQTDYALFDEDSGNEVPSQADLRRLFLGARGTIAHDWAYSFFVDFANGPGGEKPNVQDAWLAYKGIDDVTLKVGNQIELFSLEQHVSNLNQSFVERSIVHDAFHPIRSVGATAKYGTKNWSLAAGAFGEEINDVNDTDETEKAYGARATYAPINNETGALHLAAAGRYAKPDQSTDSARFDARLGSRLSDADFGARADVAGTDDFTTYALEGAYTWNNFALQGEYMKVDLERNDPSLSDLDFDGWYVHGSWFPTGEQRKYSGKKGSFGRVKVKNPLSEGGWGAWELAVRYADLDLSDEDIDGGEQETINFAVNWYPENNVRFDLNYIINDIEGGPLGGQDVDAFVVRAQVDF